MPEQRSGTLLNPEPSPQRPSWCYGTPGLARAQQLAAIALGDHQRQAHAERALFGCITDDDQLARLRDTSLCHGWAGLIHTTWRVTTDVGCDRRLATEIPRLRAHMELQLRRHGLPRHAGLLEGASGIQLTKHSGITNTPPRTGWDTCLLLDG